MFYNLIHLVIRSFLVQMKQAQTFYSRVKCKSQSIRIRRVAPLGKSGILIFGILTVMDQKVRTGTKRYIVLKRESTGVDETKLVVGDENKGLSVFDKLVPLACVGVADRDWNDGDRTNLKLSRVAFFIYNICFEI